MFNAALIGLGGKMTSDVVGFMGWILGSGNLISQTPPGLSYDSDAVARLWGTMRAVANGGLGVVTVWCGVNLITRATRISIIASITSRKALGRPAAARNLGAEL